MESDSLPKFSFAALALTLACRAWLVPDPVTGETPPPDPGSHMPVPADFTSMWWEDGFPGVVEGAPWRRCVATGHYGFVLDTAGMHIPHLGALTPDRALDELPPAELELAIVVDGVRHVCSRGGEWTRHGGPRLIESGIFLQRADVTDLVFTSPAGEVLNVAARFETIAWPDRLGFVLAARPGRKEIVSGEASFGRVRGGYGLDGDRAFEIDQLAIPETFTFEMWAFVPKSYRAGRNAPWLFCKNRNELADGNLGILVTGEAVPEARMNLGGGRENAFSVRADRGLETDAWNHLAVTYDGEMLRLYANGRWNGEQRIGRPRRPVPGGLAIGRRQDGFGDGYPFRGIADEIRVYDRALTLPELRLHYRKPEFDEPVVPPVAEWTFRPDIPASTVLPSEAWSSAEMTLRLTRGDEAITSNWILPRGETWTADGGDEEVALTFDPVTLERCSPSSPLEVEASEIATGRSRPVSWEASRGWHRVDLDGIEPIPPPGSANPDNDAIERIRIRLSNPTDREEIARLLFEKSSGGIRQEIGTPITGISAILRDREGNPFGIPVQLSKNWHRSEGAGKYAGQWFHGISRVRLPPRSETEWELVIAYGHWGGLPAASHSQLSLIGWGGNQRWDQAALGSWGENLCFEPEQVQRAATIMDARPLLVTPMNGSEKWSWTNNVGGGDFFRVFDRAGNRLPHRAMRASYQSQGPCLTEVTYSGRIGLDAIGLGAIEHSETVALGRTDDLVRATYRLRMEVKQDTPVSRFVIFQVGTDTYNESREAKMAIGNREGLASEWATRPGGDRYRTNPVESPALPSWISLHEGTPAGEGKRGAWANRGIVIRSWSARLGGKEASPWIAERGVTLHRSSTTTMDIVAPPDVNLLRAGDFVEATFEHLVIPQAAADYYGPNISLREALEKHGNTWKMVHREAVGNDRRVEMQRGTLRRRFPDIRVEAARSEAEFLLDGGLGFVPVTVAGLESPDRGRLSIDGVPVDQAVHGKDYWQTDYDPLSRTWSHTFNIPGTPGRTRRISFDQAE